MKKKLPPIFLMVMVAAVIAALLAVPSGAQGLPNADHQQGGELELIDQLGLANPLGMITSGAIAALEQAFGS